MLLAQDVEEPVTAEVTADFVLSILSTLSIGESDKILQTY